MGYKKTTLSLMTVYGAWAMVVMANSDLSKTQTKNALRVKEEATRIEVPADEPMAVHVTRNADGAASARHPVDGEEKVHHNADGAASARHPVDGEEKVHHNADGAASARHPVDGEEKVHHNADGAAGARHPVDGEDKVHGDAVRRTKRSENGVPMDVTTAAASGDDGPGGDGGPGLQRERAAMARLALHLRSLPESQEKIMPLNYTSDGQKKVTIYIQIEVLTIPAVSDVDQTMETAMYVQMSWDDAALAWDPDLYEGVEGLYLQPDSIWSPPIFVTNSRQLERLMTGAKVVHVTYDGVVRAFIPGVTVTFCDMDLTRYPYDQQTCAIQFLQDSYYFEYVVGVEDSRESLAGALALNSEWELINVTTAMYWASEFQQNFKVVISLRRKSLFYSVCLITPMVATSYMNILVFLVPLQNGEKISYLICLVVSNSVFSGFFSSTMPRGLDAMPASMKLLLWTMTQSVLVLVATLGVISRFHAEREASAAPATASTSDSTRHDGDAVRSPTPDNSSTSTSGVCLQPQRDHLQSKGKGWLMSRSHSSPIITPEGVMPRAPRGWCVPLRHMTARQLDRGLFLVFMVVNTACIWALWGS